MTAARVTFRGAQVLGQTRAGAIEGLRAATEHLLTEARKLVPIEEGTLERSGAASVDDALLQGAVSFDTVYAVYQHEVLDLRHDQGRQAKYLETPFHAEREQLLDRIAKGVRDGLDG